MDSRDDSLGADDLLARLGWVRALARGLVDADWILDPMFSADARASEKASANVQLTAGEVRNLTLWATK